MAAAHAIVKRLRWVWRIFDRTLHSATLSTPNLGSASFFGWPLGTVETPMSFQSLMSTTHRLCASMDALAALGAELRLRRTGQPATAEVRGLLREVVHRIDPQLLSDISSDQEAIALGIIELFFRQAVDYSKIRRDPGWSYTDPTVINGQGMTSRAFVRTFETIRPA